MIGHCNRIAKPNLLTSALALALTVTCYPEKGACEVPVSADSIVDSIGVNIHLHNDNTIYGNFPLIKDLLKNLEIRHIRDGMINTTWQPYYDRHVALGKLGIKGIYLTSPAETNAVLTSWPSRVPGAFEGYEAPNEWDNSGDPDWSATLNAFVPRLYNAVKSNASTADYPIIGPSLIRSADFALISGLAPYFDFANMHNYFAGRNPGTTGWGANGYGSIAYNINLDLTAWPNKSIMTTETGYYTDIDVSGGIPEVIDGEYTLRAILEQVLHGVKRTYFYELIDENATAKGNEGWFGLARADGSPKPAYTAIKNLVTLLSDPGPAFEAQDLPFTLEGTSSNVHHLLMSKRDGSYYLAIWLEDSNYDLNKNQSIVSKPQKVTFVAKKVFPTTEVGVFASDGAFTTTKLLPAASITLTVSENVMIVHLKQTRGLNNPRSFASQAHSVR